MVRKQIYLEPDQDRKLKAIATQRRCTEAEVMRDAVDRLPLDEDPVIAILRAKGLILDDGGPPVSDEELAEAECEWEAVAQLVGNIRLSDAVIEERREH